LSLESPFPVFSFSNSHLTDPPQSPAGGIVLLVPPRKGFPCTSHQTTLDSPALLTASYPVFRVLPPFPQIRCRAELHEVRNLLKDYVMIDRIPLVTRPVSGCYLHHASLGTDYLLRSCNLSTVFFSDLAFSYFSKLSLPFPLTRMFVWVFFCFFSSGTYAKPVPHLLCDVLESSIDTLTQT